MYKVGALVKNLPVWSQCREPLLAVPICDIAQILSSFWVRTEILLVQIRKGMNGSCEESPPSLFLSLGTICPSADSKIFEKACVTHGDYNCYRNVRVCGIHRQFKRHLNAHEIDFCIFMKTHSCRIICNESARAFLCEISWNSSNIWGRLHFTLGLKCLRGPKQCALCPRISCQRLCLDEAV